MVIKTKGVDLQVLAVLQKTNVPLSRRDITKEILGTDNPRLIPWQRKLGLVRYHLKKLVEEGKVKKIKHKNGYIYSLDED